jgi:hypothetical protein
MFEIDHTIYDKLEKRKKDLIRLGLYSPEDFENDNMGPGSVYILRFSVESSITPDEKTSKPKLI